MKRAKKIAIALAWSAIGLSILSTGISTAYADDAAPNPAETVSAEIAAPLKAAQELFAQKKYQEALDKLNEVATAKKSPYEDYVVERTRAAIATVSGDDKLALPAYTAVVASGRLSADEQLKFIQAIGNIYFRQADYAQAVTWMERFFKEGGTDPKTHDLLVRSYYLTNDFQHAAAELKVDLDHAEQAGVAPTEEQLRILISLAIKQNDNVAYVQALEKLVAYYPSKKYWADLLSRLQKRPGFSSRLTLDLYRLKFSAGLITSAGEYEDMANLSMLAGFPAEAKKVMEAGYQAAVLGVGPDSGKQKTLLNAATKAASEDRQALDKSAGETRKNADGIALVNLGYAYVTQDQFDTGLPLMEQGVNAPGIKRADEAKLHLATAYALAGRTKQAIEAFKTVQGTDGSADLARYWVLQLAHPMP